MSSIQHYKLSLEEDDGLQLMVDRFYLNVLFDNDLF